MIIKISNRGFVPGEVTGLTLDIYGFVITDLKEKSNSCIFMEINNMEINPGDHIQLEGRSGSGKSVLMSIIAGAQPLNSKAMPDKKSSISYSVTNGSQRILAKIYRKSEILGKQFGYLPQELEIANNKTATINDLLNFTSILFNKKQKARFRHFFNYLKKRFKVVYTDENGERKIFANSKPLSELSGGQKKRIIMACILAYYIIRGNQILVIDEFKGLDYDNRMNIYDFLFKGELKKWCKEFYILDFLDEIDRMDKVNHPDMNDRITLLKELVVEKRKSINPAVIIINHMSTDLEGREEEFKLDRYFITPTKTIVKKQRGGQKNVH